MAVRHIGMAVRDQLLDHGDHRRDMLGRARLECRLQAAERRRVFLKDGVGLFRQFADRNAALRGARIDLVVDVGDVADIDDMLGAIEMAQQTKQQVEDDERPRIADMRIVIDGRAADIEAQLFCRRAGPARPFAASVYCRAAKP